MTQKNNHTPVVSIDCQTYNHGPFVREALESFINQKTNFIYEVLVHDDASTDETVKIIKEFEQEYPDIIKPIFQQENQYSKNVNISKRFQCPRAKGKYIAICEGDDFWTDPHKLQKQFDFLESNPDYGFIHCNFDKLYNKTGRIRKSTNSINLKMYNSQDDVFIGMLLNTYGIGTLTVMARKDLICESYESIDLTNHLMGDLPSWLEISQKTKFHFIQDSVGVYRKVSGSASNTKETYHQFIDSGLRIRLEFAKKYNAPDNIIKDLENSYFKNLIIMGFRLKDLEIAKIYTDEIEEKQYRQNFIQKLILRSIENQFLYSIFSAIDKIYLSTIDLLKYILRIKIY